MNGAQRRRDLALVVAAVGALLASLAVLSQIRPDERTTFELMVPPDVLAPVERVRALFGPTAEVELVLVSADAPLADERIDAVEAALRRVPHVTYTWSARSRPRLTLVGDADPVFALATGRPREGAKPGALDGFLRPSPGQAVVLLMLDERLASQTENLRFVDDLDAAIEAARAPGEAIHHVGLPARRAASWRTVLRDARRTLPWLLGAVVLVPLLFFRSWVAVLFPLLVAGLTAGAVLVLYRLAHGRVDSSTLILLPITWSVATMDSLHLYEGSTHGGDAAAAVARTRGEVAVPALVTAGTTALSLLTLAWPGSPPLLRSLGTWAAVGTLLAYAFTFVLGGALLRVFRPRPLPAWPGRLARRLVLAARRRPAAVLGAWGLLLAAAAIGIPRLHVEPSYQHLFVPEHPQSRASALVQRAVDAELVGFDVYLEARTPRQRHPNELLMATLGLRHYLATLPETRLSLSAASLVEEWVDGDPRAPRLVADPRFHERVQATMSGWSADPQLAEWLRLDHGVSRTQVFFRAMTYERREELLRWIAHYVETNTIGYRATFGGSAYFAHVVEREALRGLLWGAVADVLLLALLLAALLRRARLVLVALAGNLGPVAVLCGVMGLLGVPWSFDLLGLPVLVLGLAIDDTVHLLWPLRRGGRPAASAFQRSIRRYGVAVMATSVLLAASLSGLSLSWFGVSRELGAMLPAGLLLGLAAELTLVPAALTGARGLAARRSRRLRGA